MRIKRTSAKVAGIAAVCAMGSVLAAAPAQAETAAQKSLLQQLQKNPNQVMNPFFQLKAASIDLAIPATLRLGQSNKSASGSGPSSSKVRFEIGDLLGLGTKETTLYGTQKLKLRLGWPLGTVKMELPAQPGGDGTSKGAGLNAAPVTLFKDAKIAGKTVAEGGCSDYAVGGVDNPLVAPLGVDPGTLPGQTTSVGAQEWLASGGAETSNRTAPIALATRDTVNGKANIFSGKVDPFTLTATFPLANTLRLPSGADKCRQAWTGSTSAVVSVNLAGTVKIAPGITSDLKLKLGDLNLATPAGQESDIVLPACLAPYQFYTAAPGGTQSLPQPTAACGADGSAIPAAQGGSPAFNGTGLAKVDVPAKASIPSLSGQLLIG